MQTDCLSPQLPLTIRLRKTLPTRGSGLHLGTELLTVGQHYSLATSSSHAASRFLSKAQGLSCCPNEVLRPVRAAPLPAVLGTLLSPKSSTSCLIMPPLKVLYWLSASSRVKCKFLSPGPSFLLYTLLFKAPTRCGASTLRLMILNRVFLALTSFSCALDFPPPAAYRALSCLQGESLKMRNWFGEGTDPSD